MRGANAPLLALAVCALFFSPCSGAFFQNFRSTWAGANKNNIIPNDALNGVQLRLDQSGGATFRSVKSYLYGVFSVNIKLVPKNSAGTVCAFFLASAGLNADEIDYEFLGNTDGKGYKIHSNVFVDGVGGKEQQLILPFDPTLDFHKYEIVWNSKIITWLIDDKPIRVFKYFEGIFPNSKPMQVVGTIFDGSDWATDKGRIPVNYKLAPFFLTMYNFNFQACRVYGANVAPCKTNLQKNVWEGPQYVAWTEAQRVALRDTQRHLLYDYCTDKSRHPNVAPPECRRNVL